MRQIKFRAWHSGHPVDGDKRKGVMMNWGEFHFDSWLGSEFLMQFTGLLDKNGKEIYEGDIFAEHRSGEEDEPFAKVAYDTDLGAFVAEKSNGGWDYLSVFLEEERRSSIIGNIYENPELLK